MFGELNSLVAIHLVYIDLAAPIAGILCWCGDLFHLILIAQGWLVTRSCTTYTLNMRVSTAPSSPWV